MTFKVFISMGFKNESSVDIYKYAKRACDIVKFRCDAAREDDVFIPIMNYDYRANPDQGNIKLQQLSNAFKLMSQCDFFVMLKEKDGSIPNGCSIEMNAWTSASPGNEPIILCKSSVDISYA